MTKRMAVSRTVENGHDWTKTFTFLDGRVVACCAICLMVRRSDGMNNPCKGPVQTRPFQTQSRVYLFDARPGRCIVRYIKRGRQPRNTLSVLSSVFRAYFPADFLEHDLAASCVTH